MEVEMKLFTMEKQNMFRKFIAVMVCVAAVFVFTMGDTYAATSAAKATTSIKVKATFVNNVAPTDNNRVLVRLYKNGKKTSRVVVLTAANSWSGKFTGLKKGCKWKVRTVNSVKGFKKVNQIGSKSVKIMYSKVYYGSASDAGYNYN